MNDFAIVIVAFLVMVFVAVFGLGLIVLKGFPLLNRLDSEVLGMFIFSVTLCCFLVVMLGAFFGVATLLGAPLRWH